MIPSRKGRKKMSWTPEKIRALRDAYDVSQREFGELLDLSMFTVRNWEQGQAVPGRRALKDLDRLADDLRSGNVRTKQPA